MIATAAPLDLDSDLATDYIYAITSQLQVGDSWPEAIYLLDYASGVRPVWTVVERAALDAGGVLLTLDDLDSRTLFDTVRLFVVSFPGKTLRTGPQLSGTACIGRLCDLRQQQRYAAKRGWR